MIHGLKKGVRVRFVIHYISYARVISECEDNNQGILMARAAQMR